MSSSLAGTGRLIGLILRRDRLRIAIWVLTLAVLTGWTASAIKGLYPDEAALEMLAQVVAGNSAVVAFSGPDVGLGTYGGRISFEVWQYCIAVALMSVFAVSRAARAEEESGRAELVRAAAVGRHAHSVAALVVNSLVCCVLALLMAVALVIAGLPAGGSLVLGAAFASIGLVFGAVALLCGQLTAHARTASGLAGVVIGATYVLRAIGDTSGNGLSWLSPFGWAQATQPFVGNRLWPLAVSVIATAVFGAVAIALERRRDFGGGLIPPRPGPASGTPQLGSALGLALRSHRSAIFWWAVGTFVAAVAFGTVVADADELLEGNDQFREYLAQIGSAQPSEIMLATLLAYLALAAAGFAVQSMLRLRADESSGRAELLLASGMSRTGWVWAELVVMAAGAAVILVVAGAGLGLSYGLAISDPGQISRLAGASIGYLPAVCVIGCLVLTLFGLRSRLALLAWTLLAFSAVDTMLGQVLEFPGWLRDLSPLGPLTAVPYADLPWESVARTAAVAVLLAAAGLISLRRRDVSGAG